MSSADQIVGHAPAEAMELQSPVSAYPARDRRQYQGSCPRCAANTLHVWDGPFAGLPLPGRYGVLHLRPWTTDAAVRRYVVDMAPRGGPSDHQAAVADNEFVPQGERPIQIDPAYYRIALEVKREAHASAMVRRSRLCPSRTEPESQPRERSWASKDSPANDQSTSTCGNSQSDGISCLGQGRYCHVSSLSQADRDPVSVN